MKAKSSINQREWVEFSLDLQNQNQIAGATVKALGCSGLLEASAQATKYLKGKVISEIKWDGVNHWDILISEAFDRLKGSFKVPIEDEELCHCRKVLTRRVDEAIVLGAHTPEKVRSWTSAGSGCGTCRPETEKLIKWRLKKV